MAETFTTAFGVVTSAPVGGPFGIAIQAGGGQIYEAQDPLGLAPVVTNTVLADWLPSGGQWVIVAIVPP